MPRSAVTIVAVKDDPGFTGLGLHYFTPEEWPVEGYTLLKQVVRDLPYETAYRPTTTPPRQRGK